MGRAKVFQQSNRVWKITLGRKTEYKCNGLQNIRKEQPYRLI